MVPGLNQLLVCRLWLLEFSLHPASIAAHLAQWVLEARWLEGGCETEGSPLVCEFRPSWALPMECVIFAG